MDNLANQILKDCDAFNPPWEMWHKRSETAGINIYLKPHQGAQEIARRKKNETKYAAQWADMFIEWKRCSEKTPKEVVKRTSPRYDKNGVKVRRLSKFDRLTKAQNSV